ncbi:MarR family winged helix-turn-helix transcriptional regulator [Paenibacillus sp. SI8]|uniref:MarR family winged helix-turn-helix transcriptional regulator n=1 Tax=unclassified Paenibacillus TaxID=185978 RepID=UPI003466F38F
MSLETSIAKLLRQFTRFQKEKSSKSMTMGITPSQFMTLHQIRKEPKTIGQIVKAVDLSYSTVSSIISRLERDGWIKRVRDEEDRRVIWICMTNKMQSSLVENSFFQDTYSSECFDGLSEEEIGFFSSSIDLLTRHLEKKVEENHEA